MYDTPSIPSFLLNFFPAFVAESQSPSVSISTSNRQIYQTRHLENQFDRRSLRCVARVERYDF